MFNELGHKIEIKWLRQRNQFKWDEIKVCLDYTKGYGYIIELEKLTSEENKEKTIKELKEKMNELNIPMTSRQEFEDKYNYYKENWRDIIK